MFKEKYVYKPIHKPNQLIYGEGQTAIITGWTDKKIIAKKLNKEDYAVIGQLYSPTRGIYLLIRNLLVNPHINRLIALNATKEDTNSGSVRCLIDFFKYGFSKGINDINEKCWIINSGIFGYISKEIPERILEDLRERIEIYEIADRAELYETVKKPTKDTYPYPNPLIFPMIEKIPTVKPGNLYGHRIEGRTIAETWVKIIHRIKTTGTIRPTGYDGQWQELIDLMAVVTDEPHDFYFPEPNYLPCNREFIKEYIPQILHDAEYKEGVKYTYGQRLRSWFGRDQIEQVIKKLIGEIDAASAVMSLWDVQDHEKGGSPCLNHIWVRVVDNELSLTAIFRSNDMFSAWVANAMGLRALQTYIIHEIGLRSNYELKTGALITISQSAHIYDDCWDNADNLIKNQYQSIAKKNDFSDKSGNFVIDVDLSAKLIIVQHTTSDGSFIHKYVGSTARQLYKQIIADIPHLQTEHAMYLGTELQKAEISLRFKSMQYIQDRPLILE